jgi:anti-anti-sigma regulatory factor
LLHSITSSALKALCRLLKKTQMRGGILVIVSVQT